MTIEDVKVIGAGSVALLCLFLFVQIVYHRIDLWAIVRRYVVARLVLDDEGTSSAAGFSGSDDLVLGQQHHIEPTEPAENEPLRETSLRQLSKDELIVLLAVQRKDDGNYIWSSNQITSFVGGAAAPIKDTISAVRGKKQSPKSGAPLKRPANGW